VRLRLEAEGKKISPGTRYRLELAAAFLGEEANGVAERNRIASAILYVDEEQDVIPDSLGLIGLLDDDHALRVALESVGCGTAQMLHWSERICSLWDELPFLQGVDLRCNGKSIAVTWLDRVNSYISYLHVLRDEARPILLLQPSVTCTPLHTLVSLMGLVLLDSVTAVAPAEMHLEPGTTYNLHGLFVRFEGIEQSALAPGWLRLRLRDGVQLVPPSTAKSMVVGEGTLASGRELARYGRGDARQRFFGWDTAISPKAVAGRLVLVTSQRRARELLGGLESNSVSLLKDGLAMWIGEKALGERVEDGVILLVVPSLGIARQVIELGVKVQALLVDGEHHLRLGRHDLPFILNGSAVPPIIMWGVAGYFPPVRPSWMPEHSRLEVSRQDLSAILELDDVEDGPSHQSLWEAATGAAKVRRVVPPAPEEAAILTAIEHHIGVVRAAAVPEYWQYHLFSQARLLRLLVGATAASWDVIRDHVTRWTSSLEDKLNALVPSAAREFAEIRVTALRVAMLVDQIATKMTALGEALRSFLGDTDRAASRWAIVCEHPAQEHAVSHLLRTFRIRGGHAVLLGDLPPCSNCLVTGWTSSGFARRLKAHTPTELAVVADASACGRWERELEDGSQESQEASILTWLQPESQARWKSSVQTAAIHQTSPIERPPSGDQPLLPCVFLEVSGHSEWKILPAAARVVVEDGEAIRERLAGGLKVGDRVILGFGATRWSPSEEFTDAVLAAVSDSRPELVVVSRSWRKALSALRLERRLTPEQVQTRLAQVGVIRQVQTIDGWLDLRRTSPIAPLRLRAELEALWPLVAGYAGYTLEAVVSACEAVRSLRAAVGRALLRAWSGEAGDKVVDLHWLKETVDKIRRDVRVYEVEGVEIGRVPEEMLGWWTTLEVASRFSSGMPPPTTPEMAGDVPEA
jgi:uncharacterized membrane protein YkvA (DUF1232 family)